MLTKRNQEVKLTDLKSNVLLGIMDFGSAPQLVYITVKPTQIVLFHDSNKNYYQLPACCKIQVIDTDKNNDLVFEWRSLEDLFTDSLKMHAVMNVFGSATRIYIDDFKDGVLCGNLPIGTKFQESDLAFVFG